MSRIEWALTVHDIGGAAMGAGGRAAPLMWTINDGLFTVVHNGWA